MGRCRHASPNIVVQILIVGHSHSTTSYWTVNVQLSSQVTTSRWLSFISNGMDIFLLCGTPMKSIIFGIPKLWTEARYRILYICAQQLSVISTLLYSMPLKGYKEMTKDLHWQIHIIFWSTLRIIYWTKTQTIYYKQKHRCSSMELNSE